MKVDQFMMNPIVLVCLVGTQCVFRDDAIQVMASSLDAEGAPTGFT